MRPARWALVGLALVAAAAFGQQSFRQAPDLTGHTTVTRALPDNVATNVLLVTLPVDDTACGFDAAFQYAATNGSDTVSHVGWLSVALVNDDGTVSGTVLDASEAVAGAGCIAGCDAWAIVVSGKTAQLRATFNNTQNVTGRLDVSVVHSACALQTP